MAEQQPAGGFKGTDAYEHYEIDEYGEPLSPSSEPSAPTGLTGLTEQVRKELERRQQNG